jgi:hypothetical protein
MQNKTKGFMCSNCGKKFHGLTPCKKTHGGKRKNQTGRPSELGPSTQVGIRFADTMLVDIDFLKGDQTIAAYVRQAVQERIAKDDLAVGRTCNK